MNVTDPSSGVHQKYLTELVTVLTRFDTWLRYVAAIFVVRVEESLWKSMVTFPEWSGSFDINRLQLHVAKPVR